MGAFSKGRMALITCSIAANAICAGGFYTFPLISPTLVAKLKLSQPQLSTIMLAAMVGQYATAAPVGKVLDRYGPWSCSLIASLVLSLGYGLFAWDYSKSSEDAIASSLSVFPHLVIYFGLLGTGTVLSYFSLLFAATRTFPQYMGFASGTSLAIFGMSPLFLSMIATRFFHNELGVDVTRYFTFLAILTGTVNLFGGLVLPGPPIEAKPVMLSVEESYVEHEPAEEPDLADASEESTLLAGPRKPTADVTVLVAQEPDHLSAIDLFRDPYFWVMACVVSLLVGAAEMIKSNIGLIVLSLPSSTPESIAAQVQLIAVSDTLTRLLVGPLADFISPVASYSDDGIWAFPRKPYVTRVLFPAGASILYALTFIWPIVGVRSQGALWPLSISTGIVNGTVFTTMPSLLASIWGAPNQGRNFGFISYTCFVGTTAFSYLYAFVAISHTLPEDGVCHGPQCWRFTFWLSVGTSLVAMLLSVLLWRKWSARV
ncbi:MFS general substrate transporter [Wolfiporia cocos MD-104 SS10]|uniref:MFS general substrate transporter n=1 Tax=Wolfiporia cocos (strain MD-104) TaxID=742152 RepID=A0A2H3JK46_WOLCO|nr:MFS general substrate transporter [Wolfiporia cocos MD-104 SS10]